MKTILKTLASLLTVAVFTAHADTTYSDVIAFGDSLSDPGNVFVVTGNISTRPYNAGNIPDAPYPIGGLNFSNGKTWIENVSATLNINSGTGPALRSPAFTNFAFGGARAASSAGGPFDMSAQVATYFSGTGGNADSDALYTLFFGGNDIRDALVAFNIAFQTTLQNGGDFNDAFVAGQFAAQSILTDAVTTIADNIIALSTQGARNFLIPNVPNLGLAPAITALGADTSTLATQLSFGFNLALENALTGIETALPVNITRFDVFTLISTVAAAPDAFNLKNVTDACITPSTTKNAVCNNADDYLFWDGIHPTRAGHRLLAEAALLELQ